MKLKKILFAISASCLLLSGCRVTKVEKSGYQKMTITQKATVNIYLPAAYFSSELEKAAQSYMNENSNVTINVSVQKEQKDYKAWILSKMQSQEAAPTILCLEGKQDIFDFANELEDLSGQPWINYVSEPFKDGIAIDEKIKAMPASIESFGIFYNEPFIEACGKSPDSVQSIDQLCTWLGEIQQTIAGKELFEGFPEMKNVFSLGSPKEWIERFQFHKLILSSEFSSTADAFASQNFTFQHKDSIRQLLDTLNASQASPDGDPIADFATGKSAMLLGSTMQISEVLAMNRQYKSNISVLPIPFKSDKASHLLTNIAFYWGINAQDAIENKRAAKDFLNWLYSSDKGMQHVLNDLLFIPPYTNFDQSQYKNIAVFQTVKDYIRKEKTIPLITGCSPSNFVTGTLNPMLISYLENETDWENVVNKANSRWSLLRRN